LVLLLLSELLLKPLVLNLSPFSFVLDPLFSEQQHCSAVPKLNTQHLTLMTFLSPPTFLLHLSELFTPCAMRGSYLQHFNTFIKLNTHNSKLDTYNFVIGGAERDRTSICRYDRTPNYATAL